MKMKMFFTALAVAAISLGAWAGDATTVNVNAEKSTVAWEGKKVGGAHDGFIQISEGSLLFEDGALSGGAFVLDMTSITVADIEDAKYNAKLKGHLLSPDFFGTEEFPVAKFVIEGAEAVDESTYKVLGNLTIKGMTHPSKFDAVFSKDGDQRVASATIEVDRTLYDVRYGSKKFFDNLGDKFIYDTFTMNIKLILE